MRVQLLKLDDWIALYVDGKLRLDGHSLRTEDVIREIAPNAELKTHELDEDGLSEFGYSCPEKWQDEWT